MTPVPVLTFLSDFGLSDAYVAEVKGVVLSRCPSATLVDVTHLVPPGAVTVGAHLLDRAWRRFPAGTVHLAVVDPGVGTARAALAVAAGGHFFVGPDNGLLATASAVAGAEHVTLPVPATAAPTFHGRDVFAPAAAQLLLGYPLATLGAPLDRPPAAPALRPPRTEGDAVVGEVVHQDRFGTLVTNLAPAELPLDAEIVIDHVVAGPLRRTYADVAPGELLALVGSAGCVEIAVRDGSAAERLGSGVGHPVRAVPPSRRPGRRD